MSQNERSAFRDKLIKGLELAEYRMLRDKAMRNQVVISSDGNGGVCEVSARELFTQLYNEPVPQF